MKSVIFAVICLLAVFPATNSQAKENDPGQRIEDRFDRKGDRIEQRPVPSDHPPILETAHALERRGGREIVHARKLRVREPALPLQRGGDAEIGAVHGSDGIA